MMNKKYVAIALVVLVAAAEANTVAAKTQFLPELADKSQRWDGLGSEANVNDYVDNTIGMIVPFIEAYGLDPMPLPDVEQGFEVKPLLITYSAKLLIHDGSMKGLVNVARYGDQMVHYFAKMLRIKLRLQFTNLEFVYKYLVKVMNIGPTGGIVGSLTRFVINIDLLFDFNNDEIQLQEFSLTNIGRLRVRLTGNILVDWLINPVITVFVGIFNNTIIKVVEYNINSAVQQAISVINANIKETIQVIESINV